MDLVILEALRLDGLACRLHFLPAAAASLWTWVAVLAVALGLWGIRALGFNSDGSPATASSSPTPPATLGRSDESEAAVHREDGGDWSKIRYAEETCSPRARFTAYYRGCAPSSRGCRAEEEEEEEEENDEEVEAEEDVGGVGEADDGVKRAAEAPWSGNCDRRSGVVDAAMALRRRADLGWYRYQDLAALNANVVRLWDGGRDGRFTATATGFSSRQKY